MLEVITTGRYRFIQWARNGAILDPRLPNFAHFGEVYFAENTSMLDLGAYEVIVVRAPNSLQPFPLVRVTFTVVSPGIDL